MSIVSLYVVDLKRVQPFNLTKPAFKVNTIAQNDTKDIPPTNNELKPGQVVRRRSFVKVPIGANGCAVDYFDLFDCIVSVRFYKHDFLLFLSLNA